MKRHVAIFSYTIQGAREKALKLISQCEEQSVLECKNKIETNKSVYNLYEHGTQLNGIRFHEAHVNDLFAVRYVNHIRNGLVQQRDVDSRLHYFMSDDTQDC